MCLIPRWQREHEQLKTIRRTVYITGIRDKSAVGALILTEIERYMLGCDYAAEMG